jgi:hypothetical protein
LCAAVAEAELGAVAARQLEFDLLDGLVELVAEIAFDYGGEGLDFSGSRARARALLRISRTLLVRRKER